MLREFRKYRQYVQESGNLSDKEKVVLLYLLEHADKYGTCRISLNRLIRETGLLKWNVRKALKRLWNKGLVWWWWEGFDKQRYRFELGLKALEMLPRVSRWNPVIRPPLSYQEKALLLYLLDQADEEGEGVLSLASIQLETGLDSKLLGRLERRGLIFRKKVGEKEVYQLSQEVLAQAPAPRA